VVLGTRRWHEWRLDTERHYTMPELAQQVIDSGALFVIAHPMNPGDPECSGCHWEYTDMLPGNARAVEVWNGDWRSYNEQALRLYYGWLNRGLRMVATGGTDLHGPPPAETRHGTNAVYADDLTEAAILAAIRKGHAYLSAGPELLLTARTESGREAMSGDSLPAEATTVTLRWSGAHPGDQLRLIADGDVFDTRPAEAEGSASWALASGEARWCGAELRDAEGGMWALANPIYLDGRPSEL
jgi:hypothetical protein